MGCEGEARRFAGLERRRVLGEEVRVARGLRARLLGLALLARERAGPGLLIPRCAAVHTFGMRFELDVVFLAGDGGVLSVRRLPPRRFARRRGAAAVLELPAGGGTTAKSSRSEGEGGEFPCPGT